LKIVKLILIKCIVSDDKVNYRQMALNKLNLESVKQCISTKLVESQEEGY